MGRNDLLIWDKICFIVPGEKRKYKTNLGIIFNWTIIFSAISLTTSIQNVETEENLHEERDILSQQQFKLLKAKSDELFSEELCFFSTSGKALVLIFSFIKTCQDLPYDFQNSFPNLVSFFLIHNLHFNLLLSSHLCELEYN